MACVATFNCTRASINTTAALFAKRVAPHDGCACERVSISQNLDGLNVAAAGANNSRIILYFHGGGHWLLTADTYRRFLCRLSFTTQARVVAVAYRKPPKDPFPAGLDDALRAWNWAREQHPDVSVAVAGDASGANLAFALVVRLAKMQAEQPVACIGISPWLHLNPEGSMQASYRRFCVDLYLGRNRKVTSVADPLVSPLYANEDLVSRFPPILMHVGKKELALLDVEEMATLLSSAGRVVETQVFPALDLNRWGVGSKFWTSDSLLRMDEFLYRLW
mmetsp:Transcript_60328/g.152992  ORF Transcript_60328/g.152992 Transcript_60328/m.152992 type:complete len:278 (-) Transcript_60328:209-1042(-)